MVRIVVFKILHYLEIGVHRHVLLEVVLVPAEALRAQHMLGNAVYHHRESVVYPPVLHLLGGLFPLRYLGRELVLVQVYVPPFRGLSL